MEIAGVIKPPNISNIFPLCLPNESYSSSDQLVAFASSVLLLVLEMVLVSESTGLRIDAAMMTMIIKMRELPNSIPTRTWQTCKGKWVHDVMVATPVMVATM